MMIYRQSQGCLFCFFNKKHRLRTVIIVDDL